MNLAPWAYRKIFTGQDKILKDICSQSVTLPSGDTMYEVSVSLDEKCTGTKDLDDKVYGGFDGTGTDPVERVASYKAVSEALEKWAWRSTKLSFMMTQFYSGLLSGKDKRAAFLEAKRKCKEKFPEPQYWAAFIMLD